MSDRSGPQTIMFDTEFDSHRLKVSNENSNLTNIPLK